MDWIVESQTRIPRSPVVSDARVSVDAEDVDAVGLETSSSVESLRLFRLDLTTGTEERAHALPSSDDEDLGGAIRVVDSGFALLTPRRL